MSFCHTFRAQKRRKDPTPCVQSSAKIRFIFGHSLDTFPTNEPYFSTSLKKVYFQDMPLLGENVKKCTFSRKLLSKTDTVVTPNTETANMTVFAFFGVTTVYEN